MSGGGTWPHLVVAFFERQGEFADQLLESGVLVLEPGPPLGLLCDLKYLRGTCQKL